MLVEQCPPVNHQEIENTLHDHNYEGTTQMVSIVVKQEVCLYLKKKKKSILFFFHLCCLVEIKKIIPLPQDSYDSQSHSVVKQEEVEQMVVCGQVSGDQPGKELKLTVIFSTSLIVCKIDRICQGLLLTILPLFF